MWQINIAQESPKAYEKLGKKLIVIKEYKSQSSKKIHEEDGNLLNRDFTTTNINER
ncbi:MAG: hypothetical protein GX974_08680 [Clostridiales bacterium]|nr:hypothetical protein [Clostridiales bacterium]